MRWDRAAACAYAIVHPRRLTTSSPVWCHLGRYSLRCLQVAHDILDIEASSEDLGKTAGKDLEVDKTTYPKLLGLERSKEVAQELVDEAKAALAEFGDAAAPLLG